MVDAPAGAAPAVAQADLAAYRLALGTILHTALAPAATAELIRQVAAELR
jgi:hypothetical protein